MLRARHTADTILGAHESSAECASTPICRRSAPGGRASRWRPSKKIDWDFYTNPREPDDESLQVIHDRMQRWLDRVLQRHPGREVVGVSATAIRS